MGVGHHGTQNNASFPLRGSDRHSSLRLTLHAAWKGGGGGRFDWGQGHRGRARIVTEEMFRYRTVKGVGDAGGDGVEATKGPQLGWRTLWYWPEPAARVVIPCQLAISIPSTDTERHPSISTSRSFRRARETSYPARRLHPTCHYRYLDARIKQEARPRCAQHASSSWVSSRHPGRAYNNSSSQHRGLRPGPAAPGHSGNAAGQEQGKPKQAQTLAASFRPNKEWPQPLASKRIVLLPLSNCARASDAAKPMHRTFREAAAQTGQYAGSLRLDAMGFPAHTPAGCVARPGPNIGDASFSFFSLSAFVPRWLVCPTLGERGTPARFTSSFPHTRHFGRQAPSRPPMMPRSWMACAWIDGGPRRRSFSSQPLTPWRASPGVLFPPTRGLPFAHATLVERRSPLIARRWRG